MKLEPNSTADQAIRKISRTYEMRGMVETITSYDGSSAIVNQVQLDYNEFSQLSVEWQAHEYPGVTGSTPNVQYACANGASSSNQIRPTSTTYPDGKVINLDYGSTDNDLLSRIESIKDGSTTVLGTYTYLGLGTIIRLKYPQPDAWLDLWGGTSGTFAGIDLFGRVTDQLWQNHVSTTPVAIDYYQYGYDRNSNPQYRANKVGTTAVGNLDEYYTYDNLNRLTVMQRGTLTGTPPTGISGTPTAEQDWTLDPTGNWNGFVVKASGSTTLNQSRTQNKVNEITAIGASTGTDWADPVYDAAGNMTSMPKPSSLANSYTATYDAWNRMIQVKDSGTTLATYRYDGRNRRITVDTGVVRHFYFTNSWQDVEERLGSLTTPDRQYVWGIRYIDELVCRDRLASSGSSSSSNSSGGGGLNERLYACQDANFNVTSLFDISAAVVERYSYDPYGTPTFRNASWADIGTSAKASTILNAGYKYDAETALFAVRFRFYHPVLGEWVNRDPFGYVDATNLYLFVLNNPLRFIDWLGAPPQNTAGPTTKAGVPEPRTVRLCIAFGSSASTQDNAGDYKKTLDRHVAFLKSALKYCCEQYKICTGDPQITIAEKPVEEPDNFDPTDVDQMKKILGKIDRGKNENCIRVLVTAKDLGQWDGYSRQSIGSIISPETGAATFGIYTNAPITLAHECGHAVGYDCGDYILPGGKVDKTHAKPDKGNIMQPKVAADSETKNMKPDKCWCERMAGIKG